MSEEKANKPTSWKDDLDNLTQLPGEDSLDKAKAWDRLSVRIERKAANRKPIWYSAAAAILLVLGVFLLPKSEPRHETVQHDTTRKMPKVYMPENSETSTKITVPSINNNEAIKLSATGIKKVVKKKASEKPKLKPVTAIEGPAPLQNNAPEIRVQVDPKHDISLTSILPVKKKLRVVHNNLLSKSNQALPLFPKDAVANSDSGPLHNELHPGLTVSSNASDNIVKIKISPSN